MKAWAFRMNLRPGPLLATLFLERVQLRDRYRLLSEPRMLFDLETTAGEGGLALSADFRRETLERLKAPFVNLGFDVQSADLTPEDRKILRRAGQPGGEGDLRLLSRSYDAEILVTGLLTVEKDVWGETAGADPNIPGSGFKVWKAQCSATLKAVNLSTRTELASLTFRTRDEKDPEFQSGLASDSEENAPRRARDALVDRVNPGEDGYRDSFVYRLLESLAARTLDGRLLHANVRITRIPHEALREFVDRHLRGLPGVEFCKPRGFEAGVADLVVVYRGPMDQLVAQAAAWRSGALAVQSQSDLVVAFEYRGKDAEAGAKAVTLSVRLRGGRLADDRAFAAWLRTLPGVASVEEGDKHAEEGARLTVRAQGSLEGVADLAVAMENCPDPKVLLVSRSGSDLVFKVDR
jgi:hypothetical protein